MRTSLRIAIILVLGMCALGALLVRRASRRPEPAPASVQASGRQIVADQCRRLRETEFGRSARGSLLLGQVDRFLREERIVFSARLGSRRGLSWKEVLGEKVVYVKVIEMAQDRYLHQSPGQLVEVLCHEAVHWLNGSYGHASIEEECDAFAGGLCAQAAAEGREAPDLLVLDGVTIAEFVVRIYPDATRDSKYVPIGATRDWLRSRTGLH